MISVNNLDIHFGDRALFDNISFFIGKGEKVALAGINGSGKTTLLNMVATGDNPSVVAEKSAVLGYLPQYLHSDSTLSAKEEVMTAVGDVQQIEKDVEQITIQLTERTDYESDSYMKLAEELAVKSERLAYLEPEKIEGNAVRLLKGLGFSDEECDKNYKDFSGGWQMRIELAKILIKEPDIILLDEPTNHLDIQSITWFENYLTTFDGTAVLISHDRRFLDQVTNRTIEIIQGDIYDFPMVYSRYLTEREIRLDHMERVAKNQEKEMKKTQELIDRFRAKASKASMAKSLQKKLDKMDSIELPDYKQREANIQFAFSRNSGKEVVRAEGIHKSFGGKTVLRDVSLEINRGEKVALVGKNGIGKSTFLKILKGAYPADSGTVTFGHEVHTAFFMQDEGEQLDGSSTVLDTVEKSASADTYLQARAACGAFLFSGQDVEKKIKVLSGGERNRVALTCISINQHNVLVLDEPTNHLDIPTKERLKKALKEFPGTVIVVSHDREFLHGFCKRILEIKNGEVKEFLGDINDFIEREKFNWLGLETTDKKSNTKTATSEANKADYKDQKELKSLQNRLKKTEQNIEKFETEVATLEGEMGATTDQQKLEKMIQSYDLAKSNLNKEMEKWEVVTEQLETFNS